jgi:DNA invertase Pin-like site-specific DNA recombinase
MSGASAVLYARRSKADPKNPGKSTTDQLDTQRQRAGILGLNVVAEFTDDGIGASRHSHGKLRPGFVAAVDYLRDHPVEVICLWELSRATRRLRVYSDLMELCEDRGSFLLVGDRIFDPLDPTDQLVLGMTAVQDSAEVARMRERTLRGVAATAVAGRPHGPNVFGYLRIYDPHTRQLLQVQPDPDQAKIIREMVEQTLSGVSAHQIIRDLDARMIRKPSGTRFTPPDVREMLTRPTYRGLRDHKGVQVPAIWPALITPAEWTDLRRIFATRSRGGHDTTAKYLLTGVAFCALCIQPMYVDTKRGRYVQTYYHCHRCNRSRNQALLEGWVREFVDGWLSDPVFHKNLHRTARPTKTKSAQTELERLRAELEDAYQAGLSPRGLAVQEQRLLPLIENLESRLLSAQDRLDLTGITRLPDDVPRARRLLRGLLRVWILPSRRGRGFDSDSVLIRRLSLGPPDERL